jgi:hypothetical protein
VKSGGKYSDFAKDLCAFIINVKQTKMSVSRWICGTKEFFREYVSVILHHLLHKTLPKAITDINTL